MRVSTMIHLRGCECLAGYRVLTKGGKEGICADLDIGSGMKRMLGRCCLLEQASGLESACCCG